MSAKPLFDWSEMMRLGQHERGLSPEVFWDMTPFELAVQLGCARAARPTLLRSEFAALSAAFPDIKKEI